MAALDQLRQKMTDEGLDAFLVTQAHNRRYLTGFSGSAGVLLITPTEQFLATDSRYYERAKQEAPAWTLVKVLQRAEETLLELITQLVLKGKKIGFEADSVTVAQLNKWGETFEGVELVATDNWVIELRATKTEAEVEAIRKAISLADQAMLHIYNWIQPGMTEKEVAWELEVYMRTRGASALSFETIVAAAENGASPHASTSDRIIEYGDPVVIDMGCVVDDYCSDLTRTFSVGEPRHENYREIWQIVLQANAAAAAGIEVGIPGNEADALARKIIEGAGYGDNFGHSLGHGVGLYIHEYPRMSKIVEAPVEEGAVITIEPGIYLPGAFGVRLEDVALVTKEGVEILTGVPKIDVLAR